MDLNFNSPSSPSMASTSSAPQILEANTEPRSSPPTATGSSQDPPDPNPPDVESDQDPKQGDGGGGEQEEAPTANGSSQDPLDPNPPDVGSDQDPKQGDGGEEEEEEEECGFCLFMKGGGCKDQFIAWESCVEEAEKSKDDVAEKCFEVTSLLKKCMDAHADYYEPILRAERAMSDSVTEEAAKESVEVEETIIEVVSEKDTGAEESKVES